MDNKMIDSVAKAIFFGCCDEGIEEVMGGIDWKDLPDHTKVAYRNIAIVAITELADHLKWSLRWQVCSSTGQKT